MIYLVGVATYCDSVIQYLLCTIMYIPFFPISVNTIYLFAISRTPNTINQNHDRNRLIYILSFIISNIGLGTIFTYYSSDLSDASDFSNFSNFFVVFFSALFIYFLILYLGVIFYILSKCTSCSKKQVVDTPFN